MVRAYALDGCGFDGGPADGEGVGSFERGAIFLGGGLRIRRDTTRKPSMMVEILKVLTIHDGGILKLLTRN